MGAGGPYEQWDALPTSAKLQIFGAIFVLEALGEKMPTHYMKGGKPGYYPSLKTQGIPHPVPFDLFDPFQLSKNASPEKKAKGLIAEINNGRLAMIGIMGFCAASKLPGSVPGLQFIKPYGASCLTPARRVSCLRSAPKRCQANKLEGATARCTSTDLVGRPVHTQGGPAPLISPPPARRILCVECRHRDLPTSSVWCGVRVLRV